LESTGSNPYGSNLNFNPNNELNADKQAERVDPPIKEGEEHFKKLFTFI